MENSLNIVFVGSDIEANYVASLLEENDIRCVVRNALAQSFTIGWVDGTPTSSTEISVNEEDTERALDIIQNYKNSGSN